MTQYFQNCKTRLEIKSLYYRLALKHHPDRGGDTATMQEINAQYAYAVKHFTEGYTYHYKKNTSTSYTQGTKTHYGTVKKRHYCYKCKAKKDEIFMQKVGVSINNRMKWECKKDCNQTEHRQYGTKFDLRTDTI